MKRIWKLPLRKKEAALHDILITIQKLVENNFISKENDNKVLDTQKIKESSLFYQFEVMTCELQSLSLEEMKETDKKAFFIIVYFILLFHTYILKGTSPSLFQRLTFFSEYTYQIGKYSFTLDDIEHGVSLSKDSSFCLSKLFLFAKNQILRANRGHPKNIKSLHFSESDERRKLCLKKVDPRILFVLNFGFVHKYFVQHKEEKFKLEWLLHFDEIEANLDLISRCFVSTEIVFEKNNTISMNELFRWYPDDFIVRHDKKLTTPKILVSLKKYMNDQQLQSLSQLSSKSTFTVLYQFKWEDFFKFWFIFEKL